MEKTGDPYQAGGHYGDTDYHKSGNFRPQSCPGFNYFELRGRALIPAPSVIEVLRAVRDGDCSAEFAIEQITKTMS